MVFNEGTTEENKKDAFKWKIGKKIAAHLNDGFEDDKHQCQIKYLNKAIGGPSIDINTISKEEFEELFWSVACNEIPKEVLNTQAGDYLYYPLTETVPMWNQLEDDVSPVPEKRGKRKRRKVVGSKGIELRKTLLVVSKTKMIPKTPTPTSTPIEDLDDEDEERTDSTCGKISSSIAANCREKSKNKLDIVERLPEMDAYEDHVEWMNELYQVLNSIQTNVDKMKPYYGALIVVINPKEDKVNDHSKANLDRLDVLKIIESNGKDPKFNAWFFADTSVTEGPCMYHSDPILGKSSLIQKLVLEGRICYKKNFTFQGKSTYENKSAGLKWQAEYKYIGQIKLGIKKDRGKMQTEIINKGAGGKGIPSHDLVNDEEFTNLFRDAVGNKKFTDVISSSPDDWEYYPLTQKVPSYDQLIDPISESEYEEEEEQAPSAPIIKKKEKKTTAVNEKPKPPFTFHELAEIAVRNSHSMNLSGLEIIHFTSLNFLYYKNATNKWTSNLGSGTMRSEYLNPDYAGLGRRSTSRVYGFSTESIVEFDEKIQKIFNNKRADIKASLTDEGVFDQMMHGLLDVNYRDRSDMKPILSFPYIVATAINSTDSKQITVADLKTFIADNYPYFQANPREMAIDLNDIRKSPYIITTGPYGNKVYSLNPSNEN